MEVYRTFVLRDRSVWARFVAFIKAANNPDKPLAVTVHEAEKPRSSLQNAAAHALVREIANNAWVSGKQFSHDAWWELLAREYGPTDELTLPTGEVVRRRLSTTGMSAKDFSEFIENIRRYATEELGLELQCST